MSVYCVWHYNRLFYLLTYWVYWEMWRRRQRTFEFESVAHPDNLSDRFGSHATWQPHFIALGRIHRTQFISRRFKPRLPCKPLPCKHIHSLSLRFTFRHTRPYIALATKKFSLASQKKKTFKKHFRVWATLKKHTRRYPLTEFAKITHTAPVARHFNNNENNNDNKK